MTKNNENKEILKPAFESNNVTVVFAADNNFAAVFSVCLKSLANSASSENNYDIVVLNTNISEENIVKLKGEVAGKDNISLRFFNVADYIKGYDLTANAHISVETYFRFLIQDILPNTDKVLYLDCDLIVLKDVAELFNTNVDGYMLAAAKDPEFIGHMCSGNNKVSDYEKFYLKLKNPQNYFQAGVILFNEAEMRKALSLDEWLKRASVPYMYNDQDVLNLECEDRVLFLDMKWNVLHDCDGTRIKYIISKASNTIQEEYFNARKEPRIIHYAGHKKPWNDDSEDFSQEFWEIAKDSEFYGELLLNLNNKKKEEKRFKNRAYKGMKSVADLFFPLGSKGRESLKKLVGIKDPWETRRK